MRYYLCINVCMIDILPKATMVLRLDLPAIYNLFVTKRLIVKKMLKNYSQQQVSFCFSNIIHYLLSNNLLLVSNL